MSASIPPSARRWLEIIGVAVALLGGGFTMATELGALQTEVAETRADAAAKDERLDTLSERVRALEMQGSADSERLEGMEEMLERILQRLEAIQTHSSGRNR